MNIGLPIISSFFGTLFFMITKPIFKNNRNTKIGNAWWYGYLYNYACHYNIEKIKESNKGYRRVEKLMSNYDFFRFYNTVFHMDCLSHIVYELSQGFIPVINDRFRVWDQFFEQPINNGEIKNMDYSTFPVSDEKNTLYTPQYISFCKANRKIASKLLRDFCRLRPEVEEYIDNEIKTLLTGHKVLGIVRRGTDYIGTGMFKQPEIDTMIDEARMWMTKYGYDKIYLATEDERIYNRFLYAFPNSILTNKRSYYDRAMTEQNVKWIGQVHFDRENDDYYKGLEYLSSIYILSKCKALLAGYCGATNVALALNEDNYDIFKVYDMG